MSQPSVNGPIDRVPCPHCGKAMDLRDLRDQNVLDTGHHLLCDHCQRWSEICAIQIVTFVAVRKLDARTQQGGGAARTLSPRQVQRLLKGR